MQMNENDGGRQGVMSVARAMLPCGNAHTSNICGGGLRCGPYGSKRYSRGECCTTARAVVADDPVQQ